MIRTANIQDLDELYFIYKKAKLHLDDQGIFQWNDSYPNRSVIEKDIRDNSLFVLENESEITGAVCLNQEQDSQYKQISWHHHDLPILVIHRLVVSPHLQGKGYAQILMRFAEDYATQMKAKSIRLDAYGENSRLQAFYQKRGFQKRGNIFFEGRTAPFICLEKQL